MGADLILFILPLFKLLLIQLIISSITKKLMKLVTRVLYTTVNAFNAHSTLAKMQQFWASIKWPRKNRSRAHIIPSPNSTTPIVTPARTPLNNSRESPSKENFS